MGFLRVSLVVLAFSLSQGLRADENSCSLDQSVDVEAEVMDSADMDASNEEGFVDATALDALLAQEFIPDADQPAVSEDGPDSRWVRGRCLRLGRWRACWRWLPDRPALVVCRATNARGIVFVARGRGAANVQRTAMNFCRRATVRAATCRPMGCRRMR